MKDIPQQLFLIEISTLNNDFVPSVGKGDAVDPLPVHSGELQQCWLKGGGDVRILGFGFGGEACAAGYAENFPILKEGGEEGLGLWSGGEVIGLRGVVVVCCT